MYRVKYFRVAVRYLGATKIDVHEVVELLKQFGYTLITRLPPRSFKAKFGGRGPLAAKGDLVIDVDTDRLILGVSSPKPEECVNEFVVLEEAVRSSFEALKEAYFYELLAELEVRSPVTPFEFMKKLSDGNVVAERLSKALGEPLFTFGYRLVKEGTSPEESEWVDIEVMPSLDRPRSSIYLSMIYRSRNREKVLEKGANIAVLAKTVVEMIEPSTEESR